MSVDYSPDSRGSESDFPSVTDHPHLPSLPNPCNPPTAPYAHARPPSAQVSRQTSRGGTMTSPLPWSVRMDPAVLLPVTPQPANRANRGHRDNRPSSAAAAYEPDLARSA